MIEEIEFLISNEISNYVVDAGNALSRITHTQSVRFARNKMSFLDAPQRKQAFQGLLIALKGVLQFTNSMFIVTYPEGLKMGYFYNTDANQTTTLRWWTQQGTTIYTYLCDAAGNPLGSPILTDSKPGSKTFANPGNNFTLQNAIGGTMGVNLNYTSSGQSGFSKIYISNGVPIKTNYEFSVNEVTGEQVVFANDWTMIFISNQIKQILSITAFPIFAAVIRVANGFVIGSSSDVPIFKGTKVLPFTQLNDPFFQDFGAFANGTYAYGNINDLPSQLSNIAVYISTYYPGTAIWYVTRKINNQNWKLAINTYTVLGQDLLFIVYMNIDSVEVQLSTLSAHTGYYMTGIILAFVLIGIFYSTIISRQLFRVVTQIRLLKDLNFSQVKGEFEHARSFIYELAELEKTFHAMVKVFADLVKRNSSMQRPGFGQESASKRSGLNHTSSSFHFWKKKTASKVLSTDGQDSVSIGKTFVTQRPGKAGVSTLVQRPISELAPRGSQAAAPASPIKMGLTPLSK
ncbi:hypothetical protein BCR33DRAFT_710891 [Rhizoclosmatium globosum]|uniref:Uncharacterized protein n=1 Tax=Rhizoclosmatium globosum TaxID=329046 RepID=A0A1Y2D2F5_9FUNG|nr:hypothetical protein BCR33DRAFT_710891 [Rhizoclosmatium globosum]|eukprot:ORY53471.1 hypothetical protein BCR33DRAFT_710891 [Rhizoclosmatium globosum]